jgi:aflatoxin B1 aldehyde reductase
MLGELDWQKRGLVMDTKYYPTAAFSEKPSGWDQAGRHTPEGLRENLEASLRALKTDKVDMWYL